MDPTQSAGATPVEGGATPLQSQATVPAAEPATGEEAALGDAGKRALDAMKAERKAAVDRAKALEAELETLRAGQLSDQEKAIKAARDEATREATERATGMVRRSEVRRALTAAGCGDVDIAALAPEFSTLGVGDDGTVDGLDKAVSAFRAAHPALFAPARGAAGDFDGGPGGGRVAQASYTRDQLRDPAFFAKHRDDILAAQREGRITN